MAQFNSVCNPGHCRFIFQMSFASRPTTEIGEVNKYMSNLEILLKYYFIKYLIQITKIVAEFQNHSCDLWDIIW